MVAKYDKTEMIEVLLNAGADLSKSFTMSVNVLMTDVHHSSLDIKSRANMFIASRLDETQKQDLLRNDIRCNEVTISILPYEMAETWAIMGYKEMALKLKPASIDMECPAKKLKMSTLKQ